MTIKDLMESMVEWQRARHLDSGVWNDIRYLVHSTVIPGPSAHRLPLSAREAYQHRLDCQYEVTITIIITKIKTLENVATAVFL